MNLLLAIPFTLTLLTFVLFCAFALDLVGTALLATYDEIRLRIRQRRNGIRLVRIPGIRLVRIPGMVGRWHT